VRRAASFLLLGLAACGCSLGGGEETSVSRQELPRLVLQQSDLPHVFFRFDEGRQAIADSPGGRRADATRFGREDGWKARYRRSGTERTRGPLVIESRADLFSSSDGATDDLAAAREDLSDGDLDWKPIDEPGLGQESFAATLVQGGVRFYQVVWRDDNVTASLSVNGFEPRLALAEVLALARKQEGRIAAAAA
jgi:hypothetical protein